MTDRVTLPAMSTSSFLSAPLVLLLFLGCADDDAGPDAGADLAVDAAGDSRAPVTDEQLLHACVRAGACGIKTYPRLSDCVDAYFKLHRTQGLGPIYDKLFACVNAAKDDCDKIAVCYGRGKACDKDYKANCKGSVAVSCDLIGRRIYQLDCAHAGLSCKVDKAGAATCTLATCGASYSNNCKGDQLLSCTTGAVEILVCAATGKICGSNYGGAGCQGNQKTTCSAKSFVRTCKGNIAVTCVGGRVHHDDCSKQKLQKSKCVSSQCVKAGTQCTESMNRCKGANLEACLDGSWKVFDCAKLGLGPCQASATFGAGCTDPYY